MDQTVADIRAFNRFYTRQIGVLGEHMVESPFSLGEGRLLYEIAQRGHTTGAELARELGVDPAYVSRTVRKLSGAELLIMKPSATDRRSNSIALSADGDAAFAGLDAGSNAAVEAMVAALTPERRQALVGAMKTIQQLLGDEREPAPLLLRPHRVGELGWLIHRQGLLYNQQFGWNIEFEALIAGLYRDFEGMPERPPKALWIAERDGAVIGSVYVVPSEGREGVAQLRMLYVEPAARGAGLGRLLVDQCLRFAKDNGYRRMRLWTQSVLVSARKIYEATGFELVESNQHESFGKELTGEIWEREL